MRNFGMTSRDDLGAQHRPGSHYAQLTPRDLPKLPSGSIRPDPLTDLERSNIAGRFAIGFVFFVFVAVPAAAYIAIRWFA